MVGANGFPVSHFAVPDWGVLRGGRDLIAPAVGLTSAGSMHIVVVLPAP